MPERVWLLWLGHENPDLIGVFDSKRAAQAALDKASGPKRPAAEYGIEMFAVATVSDEGEGRSDG